MSLLVDPDYAIYALRLAYLRKIDDHAGPRVITFPSILNLPQREQETPSRVGAKGSNSSVLPGNDLGGGLGIESSVLSPLPANSHVVVAGLNDARYQPELSALHSPKLNNLLSPSGDSHTDLFGPSSRIGSEGLPRSISQNDRVADGTSRGKGSGGLKYTSTILGPGRTGALGMRVNGRRATSGDLPKRARGASKDDSLTEVDTAEEQASDVDDAPRQSSEENRRLNLPSVQFDTISQQTSSTNVKTHRSSSLRLAEDRSDYTTALSSFRSRSSSQPHHPVVSSGLKPVGAVDEEEEEGTTSIEDVSTSLDKDTEQRSPGSNLPPSRPPRSSHRSETHHSQQNSQSNSVSSDPRRRSASEGADLSAQLPEGSAPSEDGKAEIKGEKEETESLRAEELDRRPSAAMTLNRMNSDSTILSLASPLNAAKRELSPRPRLVEFDSQRLSPMSSTRDVLASYQLTVRPADAPSSSASSRFRINNSSPLSKKAILSESMEASGSLGVNNASVSSSMPLGNSSGFDSLGRAPSLLSDNTSQRFVGPDETLDESLERGDLSSSINADARISSALGLDVTWSEDERVKSDGPGDTLQAASSRTKDIQRGRGLSPMDVSRRPKVNPSVSQRRTRSDAQQQQRQWFASLKSDQDTIARRFQSQPQRSGISAMLTKHSQGPSNPFAAMYKHVAGSSGGSTTSIDVYFPFASQDLARRESDSSAKAIHIQSKSMSFIVRKDATMEEIIGYSLYCYVEEGWSPRLDESLGEGASKEEREIKLSTLGWTLRIVEDGEVDDDYPAIDRAMLVGKFGADELAVCEATATQIKQHLAALPKVQRRTIVPTPNGQAQQIPATDAPKQHRVVPLGPSARIAATAGNITAGSLVNFGGTPIFASSALSKSVMAPITTSIFLRVLITPNSEVKYKTTLQVPSDMYLADVLETICRKRQLADVDQWAFVVPEQNIVVPLDRTVESLQGNHDLALVRRQDLGHQAGLGALTGQSTNPNASIFKRLSEPVPKGGFRGGKEIASTYKSYTVNRKQASFLGRHERILTIDGDWIHIIPTDTRAFQAQNHTTSFPVSVIASCYQSRLPHSFKLIVARENDQKRYEFEAENSTIAAEIVDEINSIIKRTK